MNITPKNIEDIAEVVAKHFEKDMSDRLTAEDQMYLIQHISNAKTYALPEFKDVWQKAGISTDLENDGKFYNSAFKDASGSEITDENFYQNTIDQITKSVLTKLKSKMLPETLELGKRIDPEYNSIWS